MKKQIRIFALFGALAIAAGFIASGATIGTLGDVPQTLGGVFLQTTRDQLSTNITTTNTNFTNVNAQLATLAAQTGAASGTPTGTGVIVLATSPTLVTPNIGAATATSLTGVLVDCASTAACPSTARAMRLVQGLGTLSSGTPSTYAVTTISPAFTSASTYSCTAQDTTTIANNVGVLTAGYVSGSAVTFTGPNTNTDTFRFSCVGY